MTKLNTHLDKTESLAPSYKGLVADYIKFFKDSQGAFLGEKGTYEAMPDTIDEPNRRGVKLIQTTVKEKFDYFKDVSKEYINSLFTLERTNSSGVAKAELVVEGEAWGEFTSLELLRLKSLLESNELNRMIGNIPVRSDAINWERTDEEMYQDRDVYESPIIEGINKTTEKESYILPDPNISKSGEYTPQVAQKTTVVELGKFTQQAFSGMWSQRQRADALRKRTVLIAAVVEALKNANDVEPVKSELTSDKIFGYLFG